MYRFGARLSARTLGVIVLDALVAVLAWVGANWLRHNFELSLAVTQGLRTTLPYVIPLQVSVFLFLGLHRGMWRHVSLPDIRRIFFVVVAAASATGMGVLLASHSILVARSVWFLDTLLLFLGLLGVRVLRRLYFTWTRGLGPSSDDTKAVLLLGERETCARVLSDLLALKNYSVRGILLDSKESSGRLIHGCPVLGDVAELEHWLDHFAAKTVVMAMPAASTYRRRVIVDCCRKRGAELLSVPTLFDILGGKVEVSALRKIEVEDLLGREPVSLDNTGLDRMLRDEVILVTGAAGSIGSELCRQLAGFEPATLLFYDHSEPGLFHLEQEFLERKFSGRTPKVVPIVGDVRNRQRLDWVMDQYRPRIVFHAAAYKHVPLMEVGNAWEALQNNVRGTYTLAKAAIAGGVERFVLVSTDKAVNPTNIMGASKRLAEMVCQSLNGDFGTRFVTVRFGNVIASQGSVIPKFREQLAKGGPLTVTSPEITRYFMSIPEAAQLVLQAALLGQGGEIFVLEMGDPVRIVDLARDMIKLAGLSEEDIKIVFTGLRPGEKLHEELWAEGEAILPTIHPRVNVARALATNLVWTASMMSVLTQDRVMSDDEVKALVATWVPESKLDMADVQAASWLVEEKPPLHAN